MVEPVGEVRAETVNQRDRPTLRRRSHQVPRAGTIGDKGNRVAVGADGWQAVQARIIREAQDRAEG